MNRRSPFLEEMTAFSEKMMVVGCCCRVGVGLCKGEGVGGHLRVDGNLMMVESWFTLLLVYFVQQVDV